MGLDLQLMTIQQSEQGSIGHWLLMLGGHLPQITRANYLGHLYWGQAVIEHVGH